MEQGSEGKNLAEAWPGNGMDRAGGEGVGIGAGGDEGRQWVADGGTAWIGEEDKGIGVCA